MIRSFPLQISGKYLKAFGCGHVRIEYYRIINALMPLDVDM